MQLAAASVAVIASLALTTGASGKSVDASRHRAATKVATERLVPTPEAVGGFEAHSSVRAGSLPRASGVTTGSEPPPNPPYRPVADKAGRPATSGRTMPRAPAPAPDFTFEGIVSTEPGALGVPDSNGDVGASHYVEIVNKLWAIYSKTGTLLGGPFAENSLWQAGGIPSTLCKTSDRGDPVVVYDELADRWVLSFFAFANDAQGNRTAPFYQCFAVSKTSSPLGEWWLYDINLSSIGSVGTSFPDYPKLGVWPDAYYMTANLFPVAGGKDSLLVAFERAKMLAGQTVRLLASVDASLVGNMLPADVSGDPPPVGSPGYFLVPDPSLFELRLYRFTVDWGVTATGNITSVGIPVASYDYSVCTFEAPTNSQCVAQPGTTVKLDPSDHDQLMYRLVYRNYGTHESLLAAQTVDADGVPGATGGRAGVRWYEIRSPQAATPTLYQQGTHAPDATTHRWLPSIAADKFGNIAVGYNVSNATNVFPGIRYAARSPGDPLGQLPLTEATLVAGGGSKLQANSDGRARWGDYGSLSVDPVDDCTFWYTGEYLAQNVDAFEWNTRIGVFRLSGCGGTPVAPGAPVLNAATPGNGQVALSWSAPVSDGGSPVTGYKIYRGTSSGAESFLVAPAGTGTSYTDGTVTNGTTYFYKVSALNGVGEGVLSNERSATPAPAIPNVNVSKTLGNEVEGTIAVDPTNPQRVFAASNGSGSPFWRSGDGGTTWSPAGTGIGAFCCDEAAVFDSYGNLFLVNLTAGNSPTGNAVALYLSINGGASFSLLSTIDTGPVGHSLDQPALDAGAGTVWVTWNDDEVIKARAASVAGLGTVGAFSAEQAAPGTQGQFGDIAIGPSGQVVVTYQTDTQIFANTDADGLGPGGFGSQVTVSSTNVETFDFIPAQNFRSIDAEANLAWDRSGGVHNGRLYLSYTDEPVDESNDTNVYVRWSDDNGATWSARVLVNDDGSATSQFLPSAAVDQATGNVALTWHDARADAADNNLTRFWGAVSTNGGGSFGPNFRISSGQSNNDPSSSTTDYGDYTTADAYGGTLHAFWADNSNSTGNNPAGANSTFDMYTASVPIGAPSPAVPGAPVLNTATAGNGQVALAWSAPVSNGGSAITGYKVYRGTSPGGESLLATPAGTGTSYTDLAAVNGTTYFYKVSAVNACW